MNKLLLTKEVYAKQCIMAAIADFSHLAKINVIENEKYWECIFAKCMIDNKKVMMEFENYLIGLSNRKGL